MPALSLQPIQVRHPHVYDQSAICKKEEILITIITELQHTVKKNQVQNEITSIYMIQVRRKETNLLVRNVLYASNTQDRPPFCKVVGV